MRYKPNQKEETHKRIVAAAGRSFKKAGYSGVGVDALAKEAGVTSGAFYGHFNSKEAAFKEALIAGMHELGDAVTELQQKYGDDWWAEFAKFYTRQKRTCDLADSCSLQSLTPEVGRSGKGIRSLFETELLNIARLAAGKPDGATKKEMEQVWASLAMLIGGVTLARAVKDEELANEIAAAVSHAVIAAHTSR